MRGRDVGYWERRGYLERTGWDFPPVEDKARREEALLNCADGYVLLCDPQRAARKFANHRTLYGEDGEVLQVLIAEGYKNMFSVEQGVQFFQAVSFELQIPVPTAEEVAVQM